MKTDAKVLLEMRDIRKEFYGVHALKGVSFELRAAEVHALVGENGAGKSTLMKILSGFYPVGSYSGVFELEGQPTTFKNILASEAHGIAIIHQELSLVPQMSIAENIFLGHEPRRFLNIIDWDQCYAQAQKQLDRVGLARSPHTLIRDLSIGEQQLVEVAKALVRQAKILILDEPTAALTESESLRLLNILRQLKAEGVSLVYISHRLQEVLSIADRITVLRDGQTIETRSAQGLTEDVIVAMMVGREISDRYPRQKRQRGKRRFQVKDWSVAQLADGRVKCKNINLDVYEGEILGVSGLNGSGRSEFFMSLLNLWGKKLSGSMAWDGQELLIRSPSEGMQHGLALLSEDRKRNGLVLPMNIKENATLACLRSLASFYLIDGGRELNEAKRLGGELNIKASSVEQKVAELSGGNQQKVAFAKWLLTKPRLLIIDEPTRGIDVGARYEIYKIMNTLVDNGVLVIMISSDLEEVIGMSDRIVVFHEGKLQGEVMAEQTTREQVMKMATGRQ